MIPQLLPSPASNCSTASAKSSLLSVDFPSKTKVHLQFEIRSLPHSKAASPEYARGRFRLCCKLRVWVESDCGGALLQASSRVEAEPLVDEGDGLCERTRTEAESAFHDTRLAADVLGKVEDRRLTFSQRTHYFKSRDGRVGGLQRLETSHRADQLLQLAMIGFDDVVQILDLSMHRVLRSFAFGLQF